MTAVTSTSKKSFFGAHFKNKIYEQRKLLIVNLALQLIGLPLISIIGLFISYISQTSDYYYDELDAIMLVSIFAIIISLLTGMIIARASFNYLYTKSLADMNYSLPLTSNQRFFADFLSGLTVYVAPAVIAVIFSLIILGFGSIGVNMDDFWSVFPSLVLMGIIVLIAMLLYYTLTVFVTVCCGSAFESVFGTFAANAVIPAAIGCTSLAVSEAAPYGFTELSLLSNNILTSTSPIGMCIFFGYFAEYAGELDSYSIALFIRWLIPSILVLGILLGISLLLYRRRKAESISKPYVYPAFNHVMMTLGIYCILSLFVVAGENVIAGIIICGIIYFILEVISKRGFKRMWASVLKFAATVAAVFAFCGICSATDGFGTAKYVPGSFSVEYIEISVYDSQTGFSVNRQLQIRDKDIIKTAVAAHEEIIDRYYNPEKYNTTVITSFENYSESYIFDNTVNLELTYFLKNGSTVMRDYYVSAEVLYDLLEDISISDEYAEMKGNCLLMTMLNKNTDIYYEYGYKLKGDENGRLSVYNELQSLSVSSRLSSSEMKELVAAYKNDIKAMTEDDFRNSPIYGYLDSMEFPVRECFENTIAFLEKNSIAPSEITEEWLAGWCEYNGSFDVAVLTDVMAYSTYQTNSYDENSVYESQISDKLVMSPSASIYVNDYDLNNAYAEDAELLCEIIRNSSPVIPGEEVSGAVYIVLDSGNNYSSSVFFLKKSEENDELINKLNNTVSGLTQYFELRY